MRSCCVEHVIARKGINELFVEPSPRDHRPINQSERPHGRSDAFYCGEKDMFFKDYMKNYFGIFKKSCIFASFLEKLS